MVDFAQSVNQDQTGLHSAQQSVICLATYTCLAAYPGFTISIPVWYHTFMEIDHEIISMAIFLHSPDSLSELYKGMYVHEILVNFLFKLAQ